MKIIGQFNLGFILTKLDDDLYIVDQHAADERYNFEQLILNTVINQQPMLAPYKLDLDPVQRFVVEENMEVFTKNGFGFQHQGEDLLLSCVPWSGGIQFGKEDLLELIGLIQNETATPMAVGTQATNGHVNQNTSQSVFRPSKVRAMLASRACRSSIMIGKSLDVRKMRQVVHHLSELEQPWTCAHGRPTMQHVCLLHQKP
eukprot:TRINITY_DN103081_c0_g1_i1.p2 TRINITY_DN103081_c0_g1~~TRINITY_DN103081_c0_g1_i1.p2  ORF type:complete len:201 (-),score=26.91 TRINITY_DN103081_c0_g1_i1:315-917(-)